MQSLRKILAEKPFFLYLNNADREVVESFTGPLPPYNSLHSFLSNLAQLGTHLPKSRCKIVNEDDRTRIHIAQKYCSTQDLLQD